jgi:hypothetical protein
MAERSVIEAGVDLLSDVVRVVDNARNVETRRTVGEVPGQRKSNDELVEAAVEAAVKAGIDTFSQLNKIIVVQVGESAMVAVLEEGMRLRPPDTADRGRLYGEMFYSFALSSKMNMNLHKMFEHLRRDDSLCGDDRSREAAICFLAALAENSPAFGPCLAAARAATVEQLGEALGRVRELGLAEISRWGLGLCLHALLLRWRGRAAAVARVLDCLAATFPAGIAECLPLIAEVLEIHCSNGSVVSSGLALIRALDPESLRRFACQWGFKLFAILLLAARREELVDEICRLVRFCLRIAPIRELFASGFVSALVNAVDRSPTDESIHLLAELGAARHILGRDIDAAIGLLGSLVNELRKHRFNAGYLAQALVAMEKAMEEGDRRSLATAFVDEIRGGQEDSLFLSVALDFLRHSPILAEDEGIRGELVAMCEGFLLDSSLPQQIVTAARLFLGDVRGELASRPAQAQEFPPDILEAVGELRGRAAAPAGFLAERESLASRGAGDRDRAATAGSRPRQATAAVEREIATTRPPRPAVAVKRPRGKGRR